jgi:hypothetical protein
LFGKRVIYASRKDIFRFLNLHSFFEVYLVEEELLLFDGHLVNNFALLDEKKQRHEGIFLCLQLLACHI